VARPAEEDIRPATLLVDDACGLSAVVVPLCRRLAGETLDTAECCVLYEKRSVKAQRIAEVRRTWIVTKEKGVNG
jgi:hypothetical protein